jgi:hypothetical protein
MCDVLRSIDHDGDRTGERQRQIALDCEPDSAALRTDKSECVVTLVSPSNRTEGQAEQSRGAVRFGRETDR